ncbi:pyridoxamine 5'-phosphate oxidase family protein [Futiania mangrovi]|uniref:Pyridoxamine 5'-phosphate oxidase family protein n=1 Tax=Futiania mangrovi TaxID=2959716 RepID=A0A9J6PFZ5_9PROT|nr:pyridoxamine 5'-phosphate oxidase family protein [Futiania mangrovii]MCP1337398.1 pyridoxamine 5'-phosphate oxidase family protein [Futiania mangrovii]
MADAVPGYRRQPAHYSDLRAVLDAAWDMMGQGVRNRRHGFHHPSVGTLTPSGPEVRTVILRGVDRGGRTVRFHTDTRSHKVAEIAADPRVAIHFYDPAAKVQVRLTGTARVHADDALADAAWENTAVFSRRCYLAVDGPGTPSDVPTPGFLPQFETNEQTAEETDAGRAHFAAVVIEAVRLEWLYIAFTGHRRARFDWDGSDWQGRWLVP